ncbi:MAG: hypothetical protein U0103_10305 [Candidatus Obscuribacterales bacterium]
MPTDRAPETPPVERHATTGAAADAARAQNAPGASNNDYRAARERSSAGDLAATPRAHVDSTGITFDAHPPAPPATTRQGEQPAARAGEQPAARAGEQPAARAGEQPAARAGEQPAARAGEQPAARAGEQPAARAGGEQPQGRAGEQPPARAGEQPATGQTDQHAAKAGDQQASAAQPAPEHWYSGIVAVAADLYAGARNEVVNHPGHVVASAAIGVAAVAAVPVVAAGAAALGVGAAAIATGSALAEGAMGAIGTLYAGYQVHEHGGALLHDAQVVANPQNYSRQEQQNAHAGLQQAGAIGVDIAAGTLAAGAAMAVRGALTSGVRGASAEGAEAQAARGAGEAGEAGTGTGVARSAEPAGPHAPPDHWPSGIADRTEPPVQEGFARLYRGVRREGEHYEFQKPLSDSEWDHFDALRRSMGEREFTPQEDDTLRALFVRARADSKWYTDDIATAGDYAQESGKVLYVDVPVSSLGAMARVTGLIGRGRMSGAFEVPYEVTTGAREHVLSPTNIHTQAPTG